MYIHMYVFTYVQTFETHFIRSTFQSRPNETSIFLLLVYLKNAQHDDKKDPVQVTVNEVSSLV